jgi:hypothetical protein
MIFDMQENIERDERIYKLRVTGAELMRCRLQHFDRLLIAECEASNKVSDKLLALETIARRIEEGSSGDQEIK